MARGPLSPPRSRPDQLHFSSLHFSRLPLLAALARPKRPKVAKGCVRCRVRATEETWSKSPQVAGPECSYAPSTRASRSASPRSLYPAAGPVRRPDATPPARQRPDSALHRSAGFSSSRSNPAAPRRSRWGGHGRSRQPSLGRAALGISPAPVPATRRRAPSELPRRPPSPPTQRGGGPPDGSGAWGDHLGQARPMHLSAADLVRPRRDS